MLLFAELILGLLDALAKGLLNDEFICGARVLLINVTNGALISSVWWNKNIGGLGIPNRNDENGIQIGFKPNNEYPWYEGKIVSYKLKQTTNCKQKNFFISKYLLTYVR